MTLIKIVIDDYSREYDISPSSVNIMLTQQNGGELLLRLKPCLLCTTDCGTATELKVLRYEVMNGMIIFNCMWGTRQVEEREVITNG